jgi:hypothetical protein
MIETESFRNKLRDLAEIRLSLYVREMGEDFYGKLIANKANWRAGYVPADDTYWVTPQTAKGDIIVGPFTVVRWTHGELVALGFPPNGLDALVDEARSVGFEKWASA